MEGSRRGAPLLGAALACCALSVGGCGDSDSDAADRDAVATRNPAATFAPLVQIDPRERWRPVSAGWLIERSVLTFAEDRGCADRKVAAGRARPEQRKGPVDWIFRWGIGHGPAYYRNPHDERCELTRGVTVFANQRTRPHDRDERPKGLSVGEGFYLDLADGARSGLRPAALPRTPVYAERSDEGDSAVRLTYWILFGMNAPPGRPDVTHEGDWERVDVLLRDAGDDRYEPRGVRLSPGAGPARDTPWSELERAGSHPLIAIAPGSHAPTAARCASCERWRTWEAVADLRGQVWYGFGGAWGEVGPTSSTTGPLGPHALDWPADGKLDL